MDPVLARKMHRTLEPYHGLVYFAPEAAAAYEELGVAGRSGYFASRAAAMGPVSAEVVIATFFNFHPALVRRSLAGVWERTSPAAMVDARRRGVDAALRRLLGDAVESPEMVEAAELARAATVDLEPSGRPLFAAHAALAWPEAPHLVLWHAQTLIREFRGDAHIACLVEAGVATGCEALVQHAATGEIPGETLRTMREWSTEEWANTVASLQDRGWLDRDAAATPEGRAVRDAIELRTDELSMAPWMRLGADASDRLRGLVRPWSRQIVDGGGVGGAAVSRRR